MPELSADLLLVLVAAFAAGLIDAMVGGGGLIQIPALFAVYPGVPPAALLGTSKFAGLVRHGQRRRALRAESRHSLARVCCRWHWSRC